MTNITLSIEESVFRRMRKHSDIKWSEYVRRAIKERLDLLDRIEGSPKKESLMTMLASEDVLKKEWDNPNDDRWDNV